MSQIRRPLCKSIFLIVLLLGLFAPAQAGPLWQDPDDQVWVGVFRLGDERRLFFLEFTSAQAGRMPVSGEGLSWQFDAFHFDSSELTFQARPRLGGQPDYTFQGLPLENGWSGQVRREGQAGRFALFPLVTLPAADFDRLAGAYTLPDGARLLIGRGDAGDPYYVWRGEQQLWLFPLGNERFLSEDGELLHVLSDGVQLQPLLDAGQPQLAIPQQQYRTQEVELPGAGISLSGTLYLPQGQGPFPGVVLLHGSGAGERYTYAVFADAFARAGVAALIYDRRGAGASGGAGRPVTLQALAEDALAAQAFLASQPQVDPDGVGLWGLSQGGRVIPQAAYRRAQGEAGPGVAFLIGLSAPGYDFSKLALWQLELQLQEAGAPPVFRRAALRWLQGMLALQQWRAPDLEATMDPLGTWQALSQPALLVYGGQDRQVPPAASAARIVAGREQAGMPPPEVWYFPQADHNLMVAAQAAPGLLEMLPVWVQAQRDPAVAVATPAGAQNEPAPDAAGNSSGEALQWSQASLAWLLLALLAVVLSVVGLVLVKREGSSSVPIGRLAALVSGLLLLWLGGWAAVGLWLSRSDWQSGLLVPPPGPYVQFLIALWPWLLRLAVLGALLLLAYQGRARRQLGVRRRGSALLTAVAALLLAGFALGWRVF